MGPELLTVDVGQIRENPVALRTINRQGEGYLGLIDSIKQKGFIGVVSVRRKTDLETKTEFYELVDGLHRFCAAKDAGLTQISVTVVSLEDAEAEEFQIMANVHSIETKPAEYSRQILVVLTRNPQMTESELATKLGKSPNWIKDRLAINKIDNQKILDLIDADKIVLTNAYALAKLPVEEMENYLTEAQTMTPSEFVPKVGARVKEIRDAKRKGQDPNAREFSPVAYMQKMKDIKDERTKAEVAGTILKKTGAKDAQSGFQAALAWVLHLDPLSVDEQKAKFDATQKKKEEAKSKKASEKAEAKRIKAEAELAVAAAAEVEAKGGEPVAAK